MPMKDRYNPPGAARAQEAASAVAVQALTWLASDMERIGGFLAQSGLGPGDLRARAQEPAFGAAVLHFVLSEDAMLLAFVAEAKLRPLDVVHALSVLEPPFDPDAPARRAP
ncbi:MAG: hypothetical protein B7Y70_09175 [Rhizobiales bacterium 35-68-8]|nr:MAG: hypothetical protein B7Y70_09175 [Rhizobiales bacterium 35-68-8]